MTRNPGMDRRRSIRLPGYDYAQPGAYFVTLCTAGRECVLDDRVLAGIVTDVWYALPKWFPTVELDEFVIMPNHGHFVVWVLPAGSVAGAGAIDLAAGRAGADRAGADRAGASPAPTGVAAGAAAPGAWAIPKPTAINPAPTLGDVIGTFKSVAFAAYLDWVQANDPTRRARFWQRNYYEHVIRSETELHAIRRYIRENPLRWALDPDNPQNLPRHSFPARVEEYLADVERHEDRR